MSLYSFSSTTSMPEIKKPKGLTIEECSDSLLLSIIGNISQEAARTRLANDNLAFVAYMFGIPAAFGWMARGKATIGELNHEFVLPLRNRYLWNFRTLEAFRGLGIYPALLQFILEYEKEKADQFWIMHAPENKSSLSGIVKAGFSYVGKVYVDDSGVIAMEPETTDVVSELLQEMGFTTSDAPSASCWNCSSPYLKKRKPECCCSESGSECTHDIALLIA